MNDPASRRHVSGWLLLVVGVVAVAIHVIINASTATTTNRGEQLELPQDFADMLGWREMTTEIARVYRSLSPAARFEADVVNVGPGQRYAVVWPAREPGGGFSTATFPITP